VEVEKPVTKPKTFTDFLRAAFKWLLDPIGAFLNRIGLTPNAMTLLGLAGNFVGAIFIAQGQLSLGGVIILVMTPFDALDGTMARLRGEASDWGAFVDSVTDRYSELAILGGVLYYFAQQGDALASVVTFAAAAGSVLVSYTKARADAYKFDANVGIMTRVERYFVLAPLLVFNQPLIAVWIVAILANITALQRIWRVRSQAHQKFQSEKINK
jgi:CDP-diacylglycerol--glycerol-3-phosphate 3-phosphatidyltransferase